MKVNARITKNGKAFSYQEINRFITEKLFHLEDQFTEEIDRFSLAHEKIKFLQLSSALSRSNYQSRIYYDYCLLASIQELIAQGHQVEYIEINQELEGAFKELQASHPNSILKYSIVNTRLKLLKDLLRLIKFTGLKLIQIFLIRSTFQKKIKPNKIYALFTSYVFQGKVVENNYFGSITDLSESKAIFMPVIIDVGLSGIFNTSRELKALKNKLIFREHYLSVNDVFKSLSHHSFEKDFAKKITTKNINDLLIRGHLLNSSFNTLSLEAHLNLLSLSKIFKDLGPPKKLILSWENQSSEKAILIAASEYEEIDTCGYVSRPIKQNEFNIIPSKQEVENGLCPKSIVVTGNKALERFKKNNFDIKVSLGPNLRYKWTYRAENKTSKSKLINEVIFLMPGDNESFKSLQRTISDLKANILSKHFKIYAKLHPYFRQSKKLNGVELIDKKIEDLPEGSIIISVASIAALEAAAMGFKTILYKNEYDQYETSLFAKGQKHPLPIFTDTIELINKIKEDKFSALDAQESIQADYFNSSINQGIDFFYK